MSYEETLTTAREALLLQRKQLDEAIAALDGLLGVPARQIVPTAKKAHPWRKDNSAKAAPVKNARGKLAGREEEIKAAVLAGEKFVDIAKRFGVHQSGIGLLARKKGWKAGAAKGPIIRKLPRGVSGRPDQQ